MKDAQGLVQGRTRWRRFAAVVIPAAAAAGAIVFGMANGAIAAQLSVSGQSFKISAKQLDGTGFVQYGGVANSTGSDGKITGVPVAMSGIKSAKLTDLCQSVKVAGLPVSLVINAGGDANNPATATDLLIAMTDLSGDATFYNIKIGEDAGSLSAAGPGIKGATGAFGQEADRVVINGLKQTAWSTTAGTFTLNGLNLHVDVDPAGHPKECY